CAIGGGVSVTVGWIASLLLDGRQSDYNPYTVKGQLSRYKEEGLPEMQDGWYVVSGRVDKASYGLLVFFVVCVALLWILDSMI
ncbi:MAG: sodium transporter, partial [Gammaproteobacteria bacterium]|nr:sodium transporter [Gammaproteobacteria bacterium]